MLPASWWTTVRTGVEGCSLPVIILVSVSKTSTIICREKPTACLSGKVISCCLLYTSRVLSRLYAVDTPIDSTLGKKQFAELAALVMNPKYAGTHNQAVMEFGALQCVPQNPDCEVGPLKECCMAYASGNVQAFPVKQNKTKTRPRYFHYLYIIYKGQTWLSRRGKKDIWEGLYE